MGTELKTILAGFGGQGVLFAGKVIAYAGLIEDREVSWLPSYGPEMRGGTANCSVTLSNNPIGSPLITAPDGLIAMNQPSFDKFACQVVDTGTVVVDSDLIKVQGSFDGLHLTEIPATTIAEANDLAGLSNIVLLGKYWKLMQFCDRKTLDAAIDKCVPSSKSALIDKNKRALQLGIEA